MKTTKTAMAIGTIFTLAAITNVYAAPVSGVTMNAQDAVNNFNALNSGAGYQFNAAARTLWGGTGYSEFDGGHVRLTATGEMIDTQAYDPYYASNKSVVTVQLGTGLRIADHYHAIGNGSTVPGSAKLNYNADTGTTSTSTGNALNIGAAYLYKTLMTNDANDLPRLDNWADWNDISARDLMTGTIRYLMGEVTSVNVFAFVSGWHHVVNIDWDTNPYLQMLLNINDDKAYWTSNYDPNTCYDEIGDYSIFVMNGTLDDHAGPFDFLYMTSATRQSAVPEPASLSVLALGGLMLLRRRNVLK